MLHETAAWGNAGFADQSADPADEDGQEKPEPAARLPLRLERSSRGSQSHGVFGGGDCREPVVLRSDLTD